MISGYYSYYDDRKIAEKKIKKKIQHILKMCIYSTLLYTAFTMVLKYFDGGFIAISDWAKQFLSITKIFTMLFLGDLWCINGSVLWFLYALFWSYICLYFINRYNQYNMIYKLVLFLFLIRMIIFGITNYYFVDIHWLTANNFFVTGLPYVMIGNLISRHKENIVPKVQVNKLCIVVIVGVLLTIIREYTNFVFDFFYLGIILYSVSIFLIAQKYPLLRPIRALEIIGEKYFAFVYVMHMMISVFINKVFLLLGINSFWYAEWIMPIAIVATCLISAIIWNKIRLQIIRILQTIKINIERKTKEE